jgi:hypothetical protein
LLPLSLPLSLLVSPNSLSSTSVLLLLLDLGRMDFEQFNELLKELGKAFR